MPLTGIKSKPNLDTLPPELLSQILLHLVPTDLVIRLRPLEQDSLPQPKLAATQYFEICDDWSDDLFSGANAPPRKAWPEDYQVDSTFISHMPAEQGNGKYGLTAPTRPEPRSPIIARQVAKAEATRQRLLEEGADEMEALFSGPSKIVTSEELDDWGEGVVLSRSTEGEGCCRGISSFMLLNRVLCTIARKTLYATNTFSFPGVHTLQHFASNVSLEARQMIKQIAINARGRSSYWAHNLDEPHQCWRFEMKNPGLELFYPLSRFKGLREIVLAGIGPGVEKQTESRDSDNQGHIPKVEEDGDQWSLKCIDLVARLIGVDVGDEADTGRRPHCLFGGTVICQKQDGVDNMLGSLRLLGTRIVARDIEYVLDENEVIVDVAAALAQAKDAKAQAAKAEDKRMREGLNRLRNR